MNGTTVPCLDPDAATFDNRDAFALTLCELARDDQRIVAICNDSVGSSKLGGFAKEFPERLINVGIAEQDMVGVGAGMANAGMIPFVCGAGPFLTGRALEQIKADVAYSQYPVILCGMSPGMAYGELGPTHHSIEDLSWLRPLPGLDIVVPADAPTTTEAVRQAARGGRPTYIRVGRFKVPEIPALEGVPLLQRGTMRLVREGHDVTIIALGTLVSRALWAAQQLATRGISARVIDANSVAPFDTGTVLRAAAETRGVVVAEEATSTGAVGAAVAQVIATSGTRVPLRTLGVRDHFAPTGSNAWLLEHYGLTIDGILAAVAEVLG